jgi:hypothetical protein
MIKITMVFGNGVWDAEDGKSNDKMIIHDTVALEPDQTPRTSHMTFVEVASEVHEKFMKNAVAALALLERREEIRNVFMILEDLIFHANRFDGGSFRLLSVDRFSGKSVIGTATNEKLAAILYLALAGDDASRSEELYPIAESVVDSWPNECRPIP